MCCSVQLIRVGLLQIGAITQHRNPLPDFGGRERCREKALFGAGCAVCEGECKPAGEFWIWSVHQLSAKLHGCVIGCTH